MEVAPRLEMVEVDGLEVVDISELLAIERSTSNLPALAGGLIIGDRIVALGADGLRRASSDDPVGLNDKWHVGSITKSMTATLAAILIEEGLLSWESTVAEVFSEEAVAEGWEDVTALDLARHLGGAPEPNLMALLKARTSVLPPSEERLNWVLETALSEAPRRRDFRYSNGNYIVLGAMLEKVSGRPWQEMMREEIFDSLGLYSAGFGPPLGSDQPRGHAPTSHTGPLPLLPGPLADNPPVLGPAGTVHLSLVDLATYAQEHLALAQGRSTLWEGAAFERLHEAPVGGKVPYAAGWVVVEDSELADGRLLHHNGSNGLWLAKIGVAPDQNTAFVCVSNFFDVGRADLVCEGVSSTSPTSRRCIHPRTEGRVFPLSPIARYSQKGPMSAIPKSPGCSILLSHLPYIFAEA
jgi:CubicO group peptidase (beta-lactamase class C family)